MRIISGTHKGRIITAPISLPARPTMDFAKEGLFNILGNHFDFESCKTLDLFCGTGNITYEFASRGCIAITAVDSIYKCTNFVKIQAELFNMKQVRTFTADAFKFAEKTTDKYDIIFADPPFTMVAIEKLPDIIFDRNLLNEGGWFILEHNDKINFAGHPHLHSKRNYGKINFSIFKQII